MRPRSVLIVEDDWRLAGLWRAELEQSGLRVVVEDSAEDAIGCLKSEDIDVVVADLHVRGLDNEPNEIGGLILLAYLGLNPEKRIKVLSVSGFDSVAQRYQSYNIMDPATTLLKPADPRVINARVGDLIRQRDDELKAVATAEENQRRAERTQFTVEHSSEAIYWIARDGSVRYANEAACRMLGYTQPQFLSMKVWDFAIDLSESKWGSLWGRLGDQTSEKQETWHNSASGDRRAVTTSNCLFDYQGELFVVKTANDVTELRQTQAELQAIGAILEQSLNEIYILRCDDLNLLYGNSGALRNLGYTLDELQSFALPEIVSAEDSSALFKALNRIDFQSNTRQVAEASLRRKDGSEYPSEIHIQRADYRTDRCFVLTVIDVTDRRWMAELQRANEDLEQFAYIASHDLKAPLRAIKQLATWIAEDAGEFLPKDAKDSVDQIQSRADRMSNLLDGLLTHAQAGLLKEKVETISLRDLVRDAIAAAEVPTSFGVKTQLEVDSIVTQRTPLATVVRNLIANAVKHHDRSEGQIVVTATMIAEGQHALELSIADDGAGIPEEYRESVFGLFKRLHSQSSVEGSGLGLSVVRRFIERAGGSIWVESNQPRGAIFKIHLPVG